MGSRGYKIGEIKSYHRNYEFSMEIQHQSNSQYERILQVGSYVRANSMVFFWPYKNEMYFGFWNGGSTSLESVPQSRIFQNNRRPFNQWYKVQLIQSTHDGRSCRQELKINDQYVWQKTVPCPSLKTGIQEIYPCGRSYVPSNAQIKNFKFFTHP